MNIFQGIIDVYDQNELDLQDAWARGVRAILHETSRGLYHVDTAYVERRKAALDKGFLWGAFHLLSTENTKKQVDRFLSIEDGADPRIVLAIDWEKGSTGLMKLAEVHSFVDLFIQRTGRYPLLYGGSVLRETAQIKAGDELLAKCPLWYARYTHGDLELPKKTWSTYTLWQFDDEKRENGGPPKTVLPGADWSQFQGTLDELKMSWPFSGVAVNPPLLAELNAEPSIASTIVDKAIREWQFFGQQTYNINGHATQVGHKEGEDGWYERVGVYWKDGVNINGLDGRDHGVPWSVAFISWVMKNGGAGSRFRYSSQHSVYVSQSIRDFLQGRTAAGFWGRRLNEQKPQIGDIVCWARQPGIDYDHQHNGDYAGHCDIVVAIRANEIDVIGGNVGDSVTKRPLALSSGYIVPVVQGGENLFALMQNRLDIPAA